MFFQDQRKFKSELTALENELYDKEERLRTAVATRQEFAGQLVAAQQRELAIISENSKLSETQVSLPTTNLSMSLNKTYKWKIGLQLLNFLLVSSIHSVVKYGLY